MLRGVITPPFELRKLRFVMALVAFAGAGVLVVPLSACGDDADGANGSRTCGDGECSQDQCETTVRCGQDCGTCVGTECTPGGVNGSCDEPCTTSCDCTNPREFCTADVGEKTGICLPVDCLDCSTLDDCQHSPDANGLCGSVTCG
jgi:hypothetical protein